MLSTYLKKDYYSLLWQGPSKKIIFHINIGVVNDFVVKVKFFPNFLYKNIGLALVLGIWYVTGEHEWYLFQGESITKKGETCNKLKMFHDFLVSRSVTFDITTKLIYHLKLMINFLILYVITVVKRENYVSSLLID